MKFIADNFGNFEHFFLNLRVHLMPGWFQKILQLVCRGRLQFVGGGWTQNDEAVTHYSAILDNLSLGMKFIADNFGNFEHFL